MSRTLSVELREEHFRFLQETAEKLGKTAEEMSSEWLASAVERVVSDPLFPFAGAVESSVPDWAARHDHYLGEALSQEVSRPDISNGEPA